MKEKLLEEIEEFKKDENQEELADILEVIDAVIDCKNFDRKEIEKSKSRKLTKEENSKIKLFLMSLRIRGAILQNCATLRPNLSFATAERGIKKNPAGRTKQDLSNFAWNGEVCSPRRDALRANYRFGFQKIRKFGSALFV